MENHHYNIAPLIQVFFGLGCFVIFYLTKEPLGILLSYDPNSNFYDPGDQLFMMFVHWLSLIAGVLLQLFGCSKIVKGIISK